MKASTLLTIAAIGAFAFFAFKGVGASNGGGAATEQSGYSASPEVRQIVDAARATGNESVRRAANDFATASFNTPSSISSGIQLINAGGASRTSQTIAQGVTATSLKTGVTATGNIAKIGERTAFVTATAAARDSSGKTKLDKIIEQNKAAAKAATIKQ